MKQAYRKQREHKKLTEKKEQDWLAWNDRYIKTFKSAAGDLFQGRILDLGCGTDHFSKACRARGYEAEGIDIDRCDLEKDALPYEDERFDVVTQLALIEHINNTENLMRETHRVLKPGGITIVLTPNWQMDSKNFYNDPTHIKPFTPKSLDTLFKMYDFDTVFMGPSLICKPKLYWKLPESLKYRVAKRLRGGTKSIMGIGRKNL